MERLHRNRRPGYRATRAVFPRQACTRPESRSQQHFFFLSSASCCAAGTCAPALPLRGAVPRDACAIVRTREDRTALSCRITRRAANLLVFSERVGIPRDSRVLSAATEKEMDEVKDGIIETETLELGIIKIGRAHV